VSIFSGDLKKDKVTIVRNPCSFRAYTQNDVKCYVQSGNIHFPIDVDVKKGDFVFISNQDEPFVVENVDENKTDGSLVSKLLFLQQNRIFVKSVKTKIVKLMDAGWIEVRLYNFYFSFRNSYNKKNNLNIL
jgi:hypothetical protein